MVLLRAYTSEAAKASFSEEIVGSLEVGKRADFVILDRDLSRSRRPSCPK